VGFRRSPDRIAAARAWRQFIESNARIVDATGLPPAATDTIEGWDDLLMNGSVDGLTAEQYQALVQLATNYFAAGYEFYSPVALAPEDQEALSARFQ
jgi:hypothetical protein